MSHGEQNAEMAKLLDKALSATYESEGINAVRGLAEYKQKALSKLFEIMINDLVNIRVKQEQPPKLRKSRKDSFNPYKHGTKK